MHSDAVDEALEADGLQLKRRTVGASERDEFLRAAWRLLFAGRVDAERLVFVDEMGTNTSRTPNWLRFSAILGEGAPQVRFERIV
jgi:hypothetical protein